MTQSGMHYLCFAVLVASTIAFKAPMSRVIAQRSNARLYDLPLERVTGKSGMDVGVLDRYLSLPQGGKIQAEYIW